MADDTAPDYYIHWYIERLTSENRWARVTVATNYLRPSDIHLLVVGGDSVLLRYATNAENAQKEV